MFKAKIWNVENVVLFKVLEMDESLRNKGELFSGDDIKIVSYINPEIQEYRLYLRGTYRPDDNRVASYSFSTTKEAIEHVAKIKKLVKEWEMSNAWAYTDDTIIGF